jgi:hypothetical protein
VPQLWCKKKLSSKISLRIARNGLAELPPVLHLRAVHAAYPSIRLLFEPSGDNVSNALLMLS